MRAVLVWIKANTGNPPVYNPSILTDREMSTATDSPRKDIILVTQTALCNPDIGSLSGLIGQFVLMAGVREYVAVYYNSMRLHSTLGYMTPMNYEKILNKVSGNS